MSKASSFAFTSLVTLAGAAGTAHAAPPPFPVDDAFVPLKCGGTLAVDAVGDDPGFPNERDVVGDGTNPAALRASDADNLYLRIRLDRDPAPMGVVAPYAWGMAFDTDGDPTNYEVLITAEGISGSAGKVGVYTNKTFTTLNSPADPADLPAQASQDFVNAARSIQTGTLNGGTPDFFIDMAMPWTVLAPLGLRRTTPVHVWAGSSDAANSIDGDIACYDRKGGAAGPPTLDGTDSDPTTGDPNGDGGGGGGGGGGGNGDGGGPRLEGGSGCAAGGGSGGLAGALLAIGLVYRRRRR
jgi:hypothetical protein